MVVGSVVGAMDVIRGICCTGAGTYDAGPISDGRSGPTSFTWMISGCPLM